ncbi:MAG: hypothetical protein GEU74_02535 [Nitriliruptorales bacterium]|nr:hypothetical protein [Nitriliruptorales bacterium]
MADDQVHRDLRLTTPLTEGPDVKVLQQTLNAIATQFQRIVDFKLVEDGLLGEKTLLATVKSAHLMGLLRNRVTDIERSHVITQQVQRMLRRPNTRSDAQKARAQRRREDLRKKLDKRANLKAVKVALTPGLPHWGGSGDVMTQFIEPFMVKRGLPLGSGRRTPQENDRVGGSKSSDHLTTKTTTAARDFPTFTGEDDARALAEALGVSSWQPNTFTRFPFSAGGRSFGAQILWGAAIAHGDHVHVGVART